MTAIDTVKSENDVVVVAAGGAYRLYRLYATYFCQPGRAFQEVERMGFYTGNEIKPEFPRILARRDHVNIDRQTAQALKQSSSADDRALGQLVERLVNDGVLGAGDMQQFFLLSPANDPRTLILPEPIRNTSIGPRGQRVAWTQGQRYTSSSLLQAYPATTDALATGR